VSGFGLFDQLLALPVRSVPQTVMPVAVVFSVQVRSPETVSEEPEMEPRMSSVALGDVTLMPRPLPPRSCQVRSIWLPLMRVAATAGAAKRRAIAPTRAYLPWGSSALFSPADVKGLVSTQPRLTI
jgi:hypothetical protein